MHIADSAVETFRRRMAEHEAAADKAQSEGNHEEALFQRGTANGMRMILEFMNQPDEVHAHPQREGTPGVTHLNPCPNCQAKPVFMASDDPDYPVLLVHDAPHCPNSKLIYHDTEAKAAKKWDELRFNYRA